MIRTILVAVDDSTRAPGVFRVAQELALATGARIHLFRALMIPPDFPAAANNESIDSLPAFMIDEANKGLRLLAADDANVVMEAPTIGIGQPWRAILQVGDRLDADLIVVGSHGYSGLDLVLGTTASRVVNLAKRNVLVVHAPGPAVAPT